MQKLLATVFIGFLFSTQLSAAFFVDSENVSVGTEVELTWSSQASSCQASGSWSGSKPGSGSEKVIVNSEGWNGFTIACAESYEYVFVWGTATSSSPVLNNSVTLTVSVLDDSTGDSVLQIEGANSGYTAGGSATSSKRTVYLYTPDGSSTSPTYTGSAWPYVMTSSDATITLATSITASVSVNSDGHVLVNNHPVYQYIDDSNSSKLGNANNGVWYALRLDGSGTNTESSSSDTPSVVNSNLYAKGSIVSDSTYSPFNRYIDVNGLRIFSRDQVTDGFIKNVADAYENIVSKSSSVDSSMQEDFIQSMLNNRVHQRIGFLGETDNFPNDMDAIPEYGDNLTDYIWEQVPSRGQIGEVLEHLLHTITNVGFYYYFPNKWNWENTSSDLNLAMQEAIDKGIYDVSSYEDLRNSDSEGYRKVITQEFAYWLILAEWDYFEFTDQVQEGYSTGSEEFTLGTSEEIQDNLPLAHRLYEDTVSKVLNKPDDSLIENLFLNSSSSDDSSTPSSSSIDASSEISYTLSGSDASLLNIDNSGKVTFKNSPDYENPLDADKDNVYLVTITASSGIQSKSQDISITVRDVVENNSSNSGYGISSGYGDSSSSDSGAYGGFGNLSDYFESENISNASSNSSSSPTDSYSSTPSSNNSSSSSSGLISGSNSSNSSGSSSSSSSSVSDSSSISFSGNTSFSIQENSNTGFEVTASIAESNSNSSGSDSSGSNSSGSDSSGSNVSNGSYSIPTFEVLDEHPEYSCTSDYFSKYINVFDIYVMSPDEVPISKMMHSAKVLASFIDNDEDGEPDDSKVLNYLANKNKITPVWPMSAREAFTSSPCFESNFDMNASMYVGTLSSDGEIIFGDGWTLGGLENAKENNQQVNWDTNLEEIWHIVTDGWSGVYPDDFGLSWENPSELTDAMDIARGGRFQQIPASYPSDAWYGYYDETCDYHCQANEYMYWGLMSNFNALSTAEHCDNVKDEWKICTSEEFKSRDIKFSALLNDSGYAIPTNIPDGNYRGQKSKTHAYAVGVNKIINESGTHHKFTINYKQSRDLTFIRGNTYYFDLSGNTVGTENDELAEHPPLQLSATKDGNHGGGLEYIDGVTKYGNNGEEGSYLKIVVSEDAPNELYYYCEEHERMAEDAVIQVINQDEISSNESSNIDTANSSTPTGDDESSSSSESASSSSSEPLNDDPFSADKENVSIGSTVVLSWNSTAQSCSAGGAWSGEKSASGSESITISTTGWNLYTLTCGSSNEYIYIWGS